MNKPPARSIFVGGFFFKKFTKIFVGYPGNTYLCDVQLTQTNKRNGEAANKYPKKKHGYRNK